MPPGFRELSRPPVQDCEAAPHLPLEGQQPSIRAECIQVGASESGGAALRDSCQGDGLRQLELPGQRLEHSAKNKRPIK
jgi:hypothetical protein